MMNRCFQSFLSVSTHDCAPYTTVEFLNKELEKMVDKGRLTKVGRRRLIIA